MIRFLLLYLLVVNVITFALYGIDKRKAHRHKWRMSEATLLLWAAAGGSLGAWLAMRLFRHKTLHATFRYGIPIIFLLQVAAAVLLTSCRSPKATPIATTLQPPAADHHYSPTTLLLTYDAQVGKGLILKALRQIKAEVIYDYHNFSGMAIRKPESMSIEETLTYLKKVKGVISVERDRIIQLTDPVRLPMTE